MSIPIDVIVPVYRGMRETRACLESLFRASQKIPFTVIVIDDHSPEPEISTYLDELAQCDSIQLYRNLDNLGFVASVNKGMGLHPERDVVLLNSDTEVANDWLDRLHRCAYSQERIASVTPFSNNATICSYPNFCQDNPKPWDISTAQLDRCFATANTGLSVEIPTAIGFCMYIRRAALQEVGLFDVDTFGKGYGEENDFCMRAYYAGWRHLLAADIFIYHVGNVSFGDVHNPRKQEAMNILRQRHPTYEGLVFAHIHVDPAYSYRQRATVARLCLRERPLLLFISHNRHGGTLRHVRELINLLQDQANVLTLTTSLDGSGALELRFAEHFVAYFQLDQDFLKLYTLLIGLGVSRVHVHHTLGLPPSVLLLAEKIGIGWDFTVHDYYSICPQINLVRHDGFYCGEPGVKECNQCLRLRPAPGSVTIQQWRSEYGRLLSKADRCFTPSLDCTQRMRRYFPDAQWHTVYHEPSDTWSATPKQLELATAKQSLKILVIGALSVVKGADLLEDTARDAKNRQLDLDFVLIGYAYRSLVQIPETKLRVSGEYTEDELLNILHQESPDVIWFTALWPETYSYTLSAALHYGIPIVAPRLGAFPERLAGRPLSWILPWTWTPAEHNDFFLWLQSGPLQGGDGGPYAAYNEPAWNNVPQFDYRRDYLASLESNGPVLTGKSVPMESVQAILMAHLTPHYESSFASHVRAMLLRILVKLRISPWMRPIVRRIPAAWQTRTKDFFLNH